VSSEDWTRTSTDELDDTDEENRPLFESTAEGSDQTSAGEVSKDATEPEPVAEEVTGPPAPEPEAPVAEPETETATVEPEPEVGAALAEAPVAEAGSEEEADSDEEEPEDEGPDFLFQFGDWYVVHTYAGYENKVKANLASRIQSMNMEDKIYEVVVPTEEVMELKAGKMQSVQKKVFPGYILVRMELDDDSWYVVRNTPGVTGFVGPTGAKPVPLDPSEVAGILAPKAEERPRPQLEFEQGEVVSVIGGAFNGYSGPVSAIDVDKQRVTVLLDLFGRETPVELTFDQVTKL
jgi:transcriptional antiterminator NusG